EDAYALKNEGQYGKTEMWYIVDSEEGAGIYLGFKNDTPKEVFEKAVEDGTVTDLLNFFPVKKGEFYFIKSGTVHAIGKGVTLCEIQQNSNLTYRVYDYKRKGADGKERPLHVEKALKVIDFSKFEKQSLSVDIGEKKLIGASKYFSTYQAAFEGEKNFVVDDKSFMTFTCVSGKGNIEGQRMSAGDSFMANAGYGKVNISGNVELIMTSVRKYYVGIDIGGTFIKGGIIDDLGNIVISEKVPTGKNAEIVMDSIAALVKDLLKKTNMSASDVCGIGMGVPGMIDSKNGVVVFSNNLQWKDVKIVDGVSKRTGISVKIANDANVAALGESMFGVGNSYDDCILLTLGTGVGGGIIVGNKLVEGNRSAGAELGHMVIKYGGEKCTCGRKGCLEAYASATALIRDTKRAMLAHKDSKMWEIGDIDKVDGKTAFDYKDTDKYAREVVDNYIEMLACGISNIANIFRPHAVMLGGGVCAQGDNLIKPIQAIVNREIFAGQLGPVCPVMIAKLGNKAGILGAAALLM
ncbi:MAG: ROK family glucokinase, partial [Clostridia bacterium]|nr:ROK family glucokinase [Clostridia bacterium]